MSRDIGSRGIFANRVAPPGSFQSGYNKGNSSSRPTYTRSNSSYSSGSSQSEKLTKDQHTCIQNLGLASAFFLPIGLVAGAVAIGTNYWFNVQGDYVGLFQYCNNWTQICGSMSDLYDRNTTDSTMKTIWQIGVPVEMIGAALLLVGMGTLVCYPCHRKVNFSKIACGVTVGIILMVGVLLLLAGTCLFGYYYIKEKPTMEWSFYLAITSGVVAFIATILFWVHVFYMGCFDMD